MRRAPRVCVVGSANADLTFRTARLPRPGETLAAQSFRLDSGGKGANQAVAAARLGAAAALVARLGGDAFGRDLLARYRAEGLGVTHAGAEDGLPTGVAAIVVDDRAENCILVAPGANAALAPRHVRDAAEAIRGADVLLCQLEVPAEAVLEAFRLARAAGVRTVLTPAPARALPEELYRLTDLCVPNQGEVELLTGRPADGVDAAAEAARELRRRGPRAVVVTLGRRGALLLDDAGIEHVPAAAVEAVDPTGAGDAFAAALAVYGAEGLPLRAAAGLARVAAALTVSRAGAQAAFPSRAEVEATAGGAG